MAVRETRPEQTRPEQTGRRIAGLVLVLLMATFGWSQPGLCCGPVCGMHAAVKAGQGFGQDSGDGQRHGAPATKMGAMHACCGSGSGSGAKVQTRDARPLSEMAECAAVRCDGMGRPEATGSAADIAIRGELQAAGESRARLAAFLGAALGGVAPPRAGAARSKEPGRGDWSRAGLGGYNPRKTRIQV